MITEHPTTSEIEDTWMLRRSPVSLESKISWVSRLRDKIGLSTMRPLNHWIPLRTGQLESHKNRIQLVEDPIHSVNELESRIDLIQKTIQGLDSANEFLRKEVDSKFDMVSQRVLSVEHRLSEVSEEVASMKKYITDGQWIDDILKVLFDEVPNYVAVPRDPMTNKIRIPEALWDRIREVLIANDQIEWSEDEVLSDSHQNPSSRQYKWMNFLNENERALHNIVDGRITMISRNEFLNLVKTEADTIWASIEKKVVGLLERDGTFEETDTVFNPLPSHSKRISKVEQQVISDLIDEALARHSADVIAKPDYGLFSAGGQVIQELTSPDYQPPEKPTGWGRLGLAYLFSPPRRQFEPRAVKAIQPDTHAGECWAMDGTHGQIGIRLARRITVTEVTIEHADPRVVFDPRSAPRELEIWRLVAPLDPTQQRFFANRGDSIVGHDQGGERHQRDVERKSNGNPRRQSPVMGTWWKEGSPWPGATLLTTIEYRIQEGVDSQQQRQETGTPANSDNSFKPVVRRRRPELAQTFSIPLSKQNVPSYGVVVRINSNWGQPDYTCLYRVRIHGYES
ncbi:hypothetical protein BGZ80_006123 [Entomortierella chlamydospora]|uniref:SUN domain-containing protein n=1 Tax=Entomortierella chlamydospora TaxID=101097 RepID=A0A9P6MZ39_9FUNG|nr:hypothetical protein BGZ80_006123 [Entomortierella chlamydospora]